MAFDWILAFLFSQGFTQSFIFFIQFFHLNLKLGSYLFDLVVQFLYLLVFFYKLSFSVFYLFPFSLQIQFQVGDGILMIWVINSDILNLFSLIIHCPFAFDHFLTLFCYFNHQHLHFILKSIHFLSQLSLSLDRGLFFLQKLTSKYSRLSIFSLLFFYLCDQMFVALFFNS